MSSMVQITSSDWVEIDITDFIAYVLITNRSNKEILITYVDIGDVPSEDSIQGVPLSEVREPNRSIGYGIVAGKTIYARCLTYRSADNNILISLEG